jgi:hypothetical protein
MWVVQAFAAAAALGTLASCGGSQMNANGDNCGESFCESMTWPRIAVVFGDSAAASLSYFFTASDIGTMAGNGCPGDGPGQLGESSTFRCDTSFFGNPNETSVVVRVMASDAGPTLASRAVPLTSFNYCGAGVAEVVVTVSDAGAVEIGAPTYADSCGP